MSFSSGFSKTAGKQSEEKTSPTRKAFYGGTAVGAATNVAHDLYLTHQERKAPNHKSIHKFQKSLKPGDILLIGSTPRASGGTDVSDLPKQLRRLAKKFGLKHDTRLLSNSTLLTAIGGGGKYHAGVYLGKGRMGHMTTDTGITTDSLKDHLKGENAAAYRFNNAKKKETQSAVNYVKRELKKKTPYQSFARYAPQALSNFASPVGLGVNRKRKGGLVCNTVPIRAYNKRKFSHQGEWTYTGDIRKAKNLKPVSRRDVVHLPPSLRMRQMLGQASKGLKWGLGAAGLMSINHYLKSRKEQKEEKVRFPACRFVFSRMKRSFSRCLSLRSESKMQLPWGKNSMGSGSSRSR